MFATLRRLFVLAGLLALTAGVAPAATPGPAPGSTSSQVLVVGGAGHLGADIVRQLLAREARVTVFTRPGSDRSALAGLPVAWVEGDLRQPAEVAAAFAGRHYDAVITAVRVEDGDIHFYATIMPPLVAGAKAAGIGQFIHASAVGAGDNAARFAGLGWDKVPGLLDRLRDQGEGEQILRDSGVPWTIIRNTRLYPPGTPPTGKATLTTDQSVLTPMTRADLAVLTVTCLGNPGCIGKTFHVSDTSLAWPPPR